MDKNYDDIFEKEFEEEIRQQIKATIKTFEIFYEELQKSNLPDNIKKELLLNAKLNANQ